jgi:hypothetical protein
MSRWFPFASIALLVWLAGPADGQPANFGFPVTGFIYSRASRTVRPLLGVPGATYMGSPVWNDVDSASIAPGGKWAVITKAGHSTFLRGLPDLAPVEASADGLLDPVDRVVWNRDGAFALLYSSSGSQLQRVRLSAGEVFADPPIDVSSWGRLTTLAIDPAGRQIAFGVAGSGLFLFDAGQSPALLSPIVQPAAAAFDETGTRLYAIDLDTQRILEFDSGTGPVEFASLAQPDGSAVTPVGLAFSGGGRYLLLADSAGRAVRVYETASRTLANTLPLDFAPSRLEALSANPVFLLNGDSGTEWLLLLDAMRIPAVSFVPASPENSL